MKTQIFDYGMNGEGVGKVDGKILLIPGALDGEEVEYEIVKDYGNFAIANLKNILTSSSQRQSPPCPYFYDCGGCALQHMSYEEQLKFKQTLIKKTIRKICNIDANVSPTIACDSVFEYRNKTTFNFNESYCGFFKENSKEIININYCLISSKNINKIYEIFKKYLEKCEKNQKNIKKLIKNLIIREINNQILVGVVSKQEINLKDFFEILKQNFEAIGLYSIINSRKDSVVISGKINHIGGIKTIQINNFGLTYFVDLVGFHQTNINIQNKLYNKVLEYVSPNSIVVNGFSGQGLLTAIIAKKATKVIGIEIEKSSHISAENLMKTNKINNVKNILGDFGKHFNTLKNSTDILILDPSKKGCGKTVMSNVIGVKEIIYISCNPIALCKDLNIIKDSYQIEEVVPFDMFPNTLSVETLVKLKIKEK